MLAAERGVYLEITARGGHSLANGRVCALARKHGAKVIFSTDSHRPDNLVTKDSANTILSGAGFCAEAISRIWEDAYALCERLEKTS